MKLNWKSIAVLTAALTMIAPILAGCGQPAGDSKAGVANGDIVVDAHKGTPAGGGPGSKKVGNTGGDAKGEERGN